MKVEFTTLCGIALLCIGAATIFLKDDVAGGSALILAGVGLVKAQESGRK